MRTDQQMTDLMSHHVAENSRNTSGYLGVKLFYGAVKYVAVGSLSICCQEGNAKDIVILSVGSSQNPQA